MGRSTAIISIANFQRYMERDVDRGGTEGTNQKVAGSIPDSVMEFLIDINPSDRTMALGSTHPPTEMSIGSISWGLVRPVRTADNLTTILCRHHEIWET
jgi:hypothetical protein